MAQLPPKIPHQNWPPAFPPHQRMPPLTNNIVPPPPPPTTTSPPPQQQPHSSTPPSSWVDEFLDFTSARRGTHRRSMSDSIAFLETPLVEECRNSLHGGGGHGGGFDRLDDEQLMSMFSDDISGGGGGGGMVGGRQSPSTPSDQNSNNDEDNNNNNNNKQTDIEDANAATTGGQQCFPKSEPGEVESDCKSGDDFMYAPSSENGTQNVSGGDPINIDPKRIKRILANRQSAQRSRVRKLQYISELERSVTSLQTEVSALSPRVAFLDHQRLILNVDNSALKQRIAALAQDKIFKDAHQEALKKEIERLRQIYNHQQQQQQQQQQSMKKMSNAAANTGHCNNNATGQQPISDHNMGCTEKEQLMT